jgi:hypothetical protein
MPALRLLVRSALLVVVASSVVVAILVVVPDGNDLALGTLDKHARLEAAASPRLAFVGGSNLLFGMDSEAVQSALPYGVANLGMNAYLGLSFMIEDVRDHLERGDVLVISLENDAYFESAPFDPVLGRGSDLLMIVKARPVSSGSLQGLSQWMSVIRWIPRAAQEKSMRVIEERLRSWAGRPTDVSLIASVETRAGLDSFGDLESHLDIPYDYPWEPMPELSGAQLSDRLFALLARTYSELEERGVRVLVLPPPTPDSYLEREGTAIEAIWDRVRGEIPGAWVADGSQFVYPDSLFWDNVNHLNRAGRELRTAAVIEHLRTAIERNPGAPGER